MTSLLPIFTLGVSIIIPLLPILTILTYYYVFESGQLADGLLRLGRSDSDHYPGCCCTAAAVGLGRGPSPKLGLCSSRQRLPAAAVTVRFQSLCRPRPGPLGTGRAHLAQSGLPAGLSRWGPAGTVTVTVSDPPATVRPDSAWQSQTAQPGSLRLPGWVRVTQPWLSAGPVSWSHQFQVLPMPGRPAPGVTLPGPWPLLSCMTHTVTRAWQCGWQLRWPIRPGRPRLIWKTDPLDTGNFLGVWDNPADSPGYLWDNFSKKRSPKDIP